MIHSIIGIGKAPSFGTLRIAGTSPAAIKDIDNIEQHIRADVSFDRQNTMFFKILDRVSNIMIRDGGPVGSGDVLYIESSDKDPIRAKSDEHQLMGYKRAECSDCFLIQAHLNRYGEEEEKFKCQGLNIKYIPPGPETYSAIEGDKRLKFIGKQ